jgi:hypothetical protein
MTLHNQQNAPSQLINAGDFAARDEHIRCLSYGVMRKLAGLPQDLFAGYWRDVLGPLLALAPAPTGRTGWSSRSRDERSRVINALR